MNRVSHLFERRQTQCRVIGEKGIDASRDVTPDFSNAAGGIADGRAGIVPEVRSQEAIFRTERPGSDQQSSGMGCLDQPCRLRQPFACIQRDQNRVLGAT